MAGKGFPKDPRKFTGEVGKQSEKKIGKQGMHHHPQMSELGNALPQGMPVAGKQKKTGGFY